MIGMFRRWRNRRACFHHDIRSGQTAITSQLIDLGRRKMFVCERCEQVWFS